LYNEQTFPTMEVERVDGERIRLPHHLNGRWGGLLFYRGHWSAHCRNQLANFRNQDAHLREIGARVVALSVDSLDQSRKLALELELPFIVCHDLHAEDVAEHIGCYFNRDPLYLQPSGFVLRPDGRILQCVYSSGPIGRLTAPETVELIEAGGDSDLRELP
jgi:peroxiredoxin